MVELVILILILLLVDELNVLRKKTVLITIIYKCILSKVFNDLLL